MTVTREQIELRITQLRAERQRVLDNANAYNGAIQEAERLLSEIAASEVEAVPLSVIPVNQDTTDVSEQQAAG